MKTATVRQLRTAFPRIESWLAEGESVTITKRKKIVAQLTPPPAARKPDFIKRFGHSKRPPGPIIDAVGLLLEERGE
jgi:antitoxin (DNA-binding transcriptional repressor) of toxin-antitoxin stability system